MKTKKEIKDKLLNEYLYQLKVAPEERKAYCQYHIDNVDVLVDEYIASIINSIIESAIAVFDRINTVHGYEAESIIFGGQYSYRNALGLTSKDLGDFPKNPTIENIDKFIQLMNEKFEINMPTRTEYITIKKKYLTDKNNEEFSTIFEETKRRNGEKMRIDGYAPIEEFQGYSPKKR